MRKVTKKLFSLLMVCALAVGFIYPLTEVIADDTYTYTLTFTIGNNVQKNHTMEMDGTHLKIDNQYVELRDGDDHSIGVASCTNNNTQCTITVTNGAAGVLNYNGNQYFTLYMQGHGVEANFHFTANEAIAVEDYVEPGPEPGVEPGGEPFDGKAYLIWSCSDGSVCMKHFDDIEKFDDGNSMFIKASDVKDARTNETFKVDAEYKGWSTDAKFDSWVSAYKTYKNIQGDIDWSKVDPEDILGDPIDMREYEEQAIKAGVCTRENTLQDDFEACVDGYVASIGVWNVRAQLQPLPDEPTDNNAYVSYGDRNFKVVVYNDEYKGVSLGDLSELNYYPAYYTNAFIRQDQFDISGTSKKNPTVIGSILLENTVTIKTLNYNSFGISKIEALDVPDDAVSISNVNGEWKIVFSSNFYDNVVFKVTDSNGKPEYFKIHRYTIDGGIRFIDNKPTLSTDFYFDRTKSYTDFDVTAKIVYKDGTIKRVTLSAVDGIDDGLGNITPGYEVDEQEEGEFGARGKGLKKSSFEYKLKQGEESKISKVYLNVEYKGSTSTNYAGAFTGSGKGVEIDFGGEE